VRVFQPVKISQNISENNCKGTNVEILQSVGRATGLVWLARHAAPGVTH